MDNPGHSHDQFVTTNNVYHGPKRLEEIYLQPDHPQAPGVNVTHIKPNFNLRVSYLQSYRIHVKINGLTNLCSPSTLNRLLVEIST